tara:strand:- start:1406 stop:2191 length:786 start_codon:yes stop_codon:yes gene_type:complete
MTDKKKNLYYLSELSDYKIVSSDSDVRGWDVRDFNNRVIGKVDNLLVNQDLEKVVYLDVEVDSTIIEANHDPYGKPANMDVREFINKDGENHVIIPIGLVDLNEDQKFVYTESIDHQTFAETKRIRKGSQLDRDYEVIVLDSYSRNNRYDPEKRELEDRVDYDPQREISYSKNTDLSSKNDVAKDVHSREEKSREAQLRGDNTYEEELARNSENYVDSTEGDLERRDARKAVDSDNMGPDYEDNRFYNRREFDDSRFRRKK